MAEDRRIRVTRLVADEIRRHAPEGGVGVAVERRTGGNAGWSVTIRLGAVGVSALIVGSDEDPYAVPDGLFAAVARDLLADARKKAARARRSGIEGTRGIDHEQDPQVGL